MSTFLVFAIFKVLTFHFFLMITQELKKNSTGEKLKLSLIIDLIALFLELIWVFPWASRALYLAPFWRSYQKQKRPGANSKALEAALVDFMGIFI